MDTLGHSNRASALGPALSAPEADPDEDELPNIFEYAMGGDPRSADAAAVMAKVDLARESDSGGDFLAMTVNRPAARHCNASYVVELSPNLDDWSYGEGLNALTLFNEATLLKVRDLRYL